MFPFLTNFFVSPGLAMAGGLLIASPIIIHFINRMRFRRVRFAAMEFLLASQQRNRRRLLIEQLILLLLRILIVLALAALIARLILDPSQMAILGGARSHHIVLLDDSGSMRDQWGETTAFDEGLDVIRQLVQEGATRPNTQEFTLILLSDPEHPVAGLNQRKVNLDFVHEVETKLENLKCTRQAFDLNDGLEGARILFEEEKSGNKHLHVISDFRSSNWLDQPAIVKGVKNLDKAGIAVNLVKTVKERHQNIGITSISGDIHMAAAGVPLELTVRVKNFDEQTPAEDVRVAIFADKKKLPLNVVFKEIKPGVEVEKTEIVEGFETAGAHSIELKLDPDALAADNSRFLAIDVKPASRVLVIDGDPAGDDSFFISMTMAAYQESGMSPLVENVDYLGRRPLDEFKCIFLLNVPQIPADAIQPLREYLLGGGGLAWFVGDTVNPAFYNDTLYPEDEDGNRFFPVPLGGSRSELVRDDFTLPGPDLALKPPYHPIFDKLISGQVNSYLGAVSVYEYLPVHEDWVRSDNERKDGVTTSVSLRNGAPLMFEHRFGAGRVITFLTTAGPIWNNWAKNGSYPPIILDLVKYISRRDSDLRQRNVGEVIQLSYSEVDYLRELDITPAGGTEMRLTAARQQGKTDTEDDEPQLTATFRDTGLPGIYKIKRIHQVTGEENVYLAYNVTPDESSLALAASNEIGKRLGPDVDVTIQDAGNTEWIEGEEAGQEVRQALLFILLIALLLEQFLAYIFSYHPKTAGATA
jgi:hypothetical protein